MIPAKIQTGFSPVETNEPDSDMLFRVKVLLFTFLEKAVVIAATYAKEAKRNTVTPQDVKYALKYLAHEFFDSPDLEEKLRESMTAWTDKPMLKALEAYENALEAPTDEDDSDESDRLSDASAESSEDEFAEAVDSENPMIQKMNQYNKEWDDWNPNDEVQMSLKKAINEISVDDLVQHM